MDTARRRRRRALLSWALLLAAAGAALAWGHARAVAQVEVAAGDPARGGRLYTLQCAECHNPDGRGGVTPAGRRAPAIDDVSVAYARLVLVTGRMPPGGDPFDSRERSDTFDRRDMADVLAYMVERFALTGDVDAPPEGDPARGLELYSRHCAACHGATGAGGVAGAGVWTPRINTYDPRVVASAVRVGPFEMPRFGRGILTAQEVGDIAAFLSEVDEEEGTLLFPGELNPVYASAFGALLALVVLVLVVVISGKPFWVPDEEAGDGGPAGPEGPTDEGRAG